MGDGGTRDRKAAEKDGWGHGWRRLPGTRLDTSEIKDMTFA